MLSMSDSPQPYAVARELLRLCTDREMDLASAMSTLTFACAMIAASQDPERRPKVIETLVAAIKIYCERYDEMMADARDRAKEMAD